MIKRIIRTGGLSLVDDLYSKRIQEYSANLVAHWPLDDLPGGVALDLSGNGNHGAVTGATLSQPGIGDGLKSMGFDSANDFVDISAIASDLISNGGFETAGAGEAGVWDWWAEQVGDGALANEGVEIHTGASAAKLTSGATSNTRIERANIPVVAGATYKMRFWTQGDGTHDGRHRVYDISNSSDIVASTGTGVTGATYAMVDVDFTAPAGCTLIKIYFYCANNNTSVVYFDTVSLRRTDVPTFDPHEGSLIVWAKMASGAWTDGTIRYPISIYADDGNRYQVLKHSNNNELLFIANTNSVSETYTHSISEAAFFPIGMTWSLSGDVVNYYAERALVGTDTILGVFTGNLGSEAVLGASSSVPANVHHGNLAHGILANTAWDADTMKYLMRRPS